MQKLLANFYPAKEPKNGYIGRASLTIGGAFRFDGISVFEKDGKYSFQFPGFKSNGKTVSYVRPNGSEMYNAIAEVIKMAVENQEKHFGYNKGLNGPFIEVTEGKLVEEPYADGRYTVAVGENVKVEGESKPPFKPLMYLSGITSRETVDDKGETRVDVYSPTVDSFTDKEGNVRFKRSFEALNYKYKVGEEEKSTNYGRLLKSLVVNKRSDLIAQRDAQHQQEAQEPAQEDFEEPERDGSDIDEMMKKASKNARKSNSSKTSKSKTKKTEEPEK